LHGQKALFGGCIVMGLGGTVLEYVPWHWPKPPDELTNDHPKQPPAANIRNFQKQNFALKIQILRLNKLFWAKTFGVRQTNAFFVNPAFVFSLPPLQGFGPQTFHLGALYNQFSVLSNNQPDTFAAAA